MKYLTDVILREEYNALDKVIFTKKGIKLAEHALNLGPQVNIKKFLELYKMHEDLAVMREHLKNDDEVDGSDSIVELMRFSLKDYDNRTIEIGKPNYEKLISKLEQHKGLDFTVNYKYWFFEPLDIQKWKMHKPKSGERLLLYALDFENYKDNKPKAEENQKKAIRECTHELGVFVADKPKKYMKWAHRTYKINAKGGMHARPSAQLITIANKYTGDVWLRTDSNEFIGKSIMSLLMNGVTSDKNLTILYRPEEEDKRKDIAKIKAEAEPFYGDLEAIEIEKGKPLFTKIR